MKTIPPVCRINVSARLIVLACFLSAMGEMALSAEHSPQPPEILGTGQQACFFEQSPDPYQPARDATMSEGEPTSPNSVESGQTQYVDINTIVVVYSSYYFSEEAQINLSTEDLSVIRGQVEKARRFLWRASNLKCNMRTDFLIIDRTLTTEQMWEFTPGQGNYWLPYWSSDGGATSVEQDLHNAGIADGEYSVVLVLYAFENSPQAYAAIGGGAYGAGIGCMGDAAYIGIPLAWGLGCEGFITHEYCHALDSIFENSGNPGGNDPHHADIPASFPHLIDCGTHFNYLIHNVLDAGCWQMLDPAWATVRTIADDDDDGVPNYGDLSITEASLGTNPNDSDSDHDLLRDSAELTISYLGECDPRAIDTDGDLLLDGNDAYPLIAFNDLVPRGVPQLDGVIAPGEYAFVKSLQVAIPDHAVNLHARWSPNLLHIAAEVTDELISTYYYEWWWSDNLEIQIDANRDGWFYHGDQNYRVVVVPRGSTGIPEVSAQVNRQDVSGNWAWHDLDTSGVAARYSLRSDGYVVELTVPSGLMPGITVATNQSLRLSAQTEDFDTWPGWPRYNLFTGREETAFVTLRFADGPSIPRIAKNGTDIALAWDAFPGLSYAVETSPDLRAWTRVSVGIAPPQSIGPTRSQILWIDPGVLGIHRQRFYRVHDEYLSPPAP